jgi:hypothetical protein
VIVKYTVAGGTNSLLNVVNGDSTWIASGDSIDISKPLVLKSFAMSGKTKLYDIRLNIHQIDPDSVQYNLFAADLNFLDYADSKTVRFNDSYYTFVNVSLPAISGYSSAITGYKSSDLKNWEQISISLPINAVAKGVQVNNEKIYLYTQTYHIEGNWGEIYASEDAVNWEKMETEYSVTALLGLLRNNTASGLAAIIENTEGKQVFAFSSDFSEWTEGTEIDTNFPVSGFSTINSRDYGQETITLVGGNALSGDTLTTVWATQDGLHWVKLSDKLPVVSGANAFAYNGELYLLNGKRGDEFNENVYYSIDRGVSWKTKAAKYSPPASYSQRYNASVVTDKEGNYFYIIGGQKEVPLTDIWQCFLNKRLFDR